MLDARDTIGSTVSVREAEAQIKGILIERAKDRWDFAYDGPKAMACISEFVAEGVVIFGIRFQHHFYPGSVAVYEPIAIRMAGIGPVSKQALASRRIFPKQPAILKPRPVIGNKVRIKRFTALRRLFENFHSWSLRIPWDIAHSL